MSAALSCQSAKTIHNIYSLLSKDRKKKTIQYIAAIFYEIYLYPRASIPDIILVKTCYKYKDKKISECENK